MKYAVPLKVEVVNVVAFNITINAESDEDAAQQAARYVERVRQKLVEAVGSEDTVRITPLPQNMKEFAEE